jgi:hypothetical protein
VVCAQIKLSVIDSSIGNIDLSLLNGLISVLEPIVQKTVNTALVRLSTSIAIVAATLRSLAVHASLQAHGFPLPLGHGITLNNPVFTFQVPD